MGEPGDRIAGLERGVDDYLGKPFEPRELLLRVRSILRRVPVTPVAPTEVHMGDVMFDPGREELRRGGQPVRLTSVEVALLKALAERPGEVLSRDELFERTGAGGGGRAVDVQVTRLRRKIEPDPRLPAICKPYAAGATCSVPIEPWPGRASSRDYCRAACSGVRFSSSSRPWCCCRWCRGLSFRKPLGQGEPAHGPQPGRRHRHPGGAHPRVPGRPDRERILHLAGDPMQVVARLKQGRTFPIRRPWPRHDGGNADPRHGGVRRQALPNRTRAPWTAT